MDKPTVSGEIKTAKTIYDYVREFAEIEKEVRKKGIDLLLLKFKQCQIVKNVYDFYGTEGLKKIAKTLGYNERYLYDYLKIAITFKDEKEFLQIVSIKNLNTLRKVIEYTEEKMRIPAIAKVAKKVERDIETIEKKIAEIEETVERHFAPELSEEVKLVKSEFLQFKENLKKIYEEYIINILWEIKKIENPHPKEKIYLFDRLKEALDKL